MVYPVDNVVIVTDSYKVSHYEQYPPGTTKLYSYFESRGGKFPSTVFFGLQYIIKRWLQGPVVTKEKVEEAKIFCNAHIRQEIFNYDGWMRIVDHHKGMLPLRIKAVPEGIFLPTRNVLFTVENTDPELPWLTNWFETLLVQVWYPMTIATLSRYFKELLGQYLIETSDSLDCLLTQLHEYGFRGVSSVEQAAIGGAAHLVNFIGSDTMAGVWMCQKYYNCPMAGFAVRASEHSTTTSWGSTPKEELAAMTHMLNVFPNGIISAVADSYDVYNFCRSIIGEKLKSRIIERGSKEGNILAIRLDSGDAAEVVTKVLNILGEKFGFTVNSKGYKMLPPYLQIIQGDGICYESLETLLPCIKNSGWSTANLVFGSGGALMQQVNRDTQKCAFKCSYAYIENRGHVDVYKDPITDHGKMSKRGLLTLELMENDGGKPEYVTREQNSGDPSKDLLVTVFENGTLVKEYSMDEVRRNARIDLNGIVI